MVRGALLFLGLAAMLASSGCATGEARKHYKYRAKPRPYPAVRMNFGDPDWPVKGGGDILNFDAALSCLILPLDLPISLVVDTLLLPMDLVRWRTEVVNERYVSNALYSAQMPTAEEFRRHYLPNYSGWVIHDYVTQPPERVSRQRLTMLQAADVNTWILAASNLMEEEFADELIARMLHDAHPIESLRLLLQNPRLPAAALKRLASSKDEVVLRDVAAHHRTPPDVLRTLANDATCVEAVAGNTNTPPDVLVRLLDKPTCLYPVLRNPSTPPEALLKAIRVGPQGCFNCIAYHPRATPDVDMALLEVGRQFFAQAGQSSTNRYWIDQALTEVAKRDQPVDRLLDMARLPFPTMQQMLSAHRKADSNVLATVIATCSKVDPTDSGQYYFTWAIDNARRRLDHMKAK